MQERSPFERFLVSDERQAASARPGAWQNKTSTITFVLLAVGAAFGAGIRTTEYPAVAWAAFLVFAALVASRLSGFDEATQRAFRERDDMQAALDVALGECDRLSSVGRTLAREHTTLRASLETSQALNTKLTADYADIQRQLDGHKQTIDMQCQQLAQYSALIERFTTVDSATTVYTGPTERLEEVA